MGAESKKVEQGKQEAGAAENKTVKNEERKENKGKEETQEIVLKVDMHCEACAKKVAGSLRGFKGVEEVRVECKANKVVVKAAKGVDPLQVQDRVHKKSGRKVDILSPLPADTPKPEPNVDSISKPPIVAEDPPKKHQAPPPVTTVVLQVGMHCEACAQALRRSIRKISGVESVETDVANDRVTVKGVIENPDQLAQLIYKRSRKHASILKEEDDKPKPAEPKGEDNQKDSEKKQGDDVSNKDRESGQGGDEHNTLDKFEHWPTKAYMDYYYADAPQLFSDENPNACTIM